jgi:hypothetical protein
MMDAAPLMPAYPTLAPEYEGVPRFGFWPIPAQTGWQWLVLTSDQGGDWIEALVDGRIVVTVPRPSQICPSVTSPSETVEGHRITIYAETWDQGWSVRCDVFVDGYSLTTRESLTAIAHRQAAFGNATQPAAPSGLFGKRALESVVIVAAFTWGEMAVIAREAHGALGLALATVLVLTANFALVRPWRFAYGWLRKSDWQQPLVGLAACGIAVGFAISAVPVTIAALFIARLP